MLTQQDIQCNTTQVFEQMQISLQKYLRAKNVQDRTKTYIAYCHLNVTDNALWGKLILFIDKLTIVLFKYFIVFVKDVSIHPRLIF